MENLENNEIIDQEIDYKAEYEKMIAEKEREKAINGFKGAVSNKGYVINEELFSTMCNEYDNKTLEGFSKIINAVERKPPQITGVTPRDGYSMPIKKEVEKVTFNDYVSNK